MSRHCVGDIIEQAEWARFHAEINCFSSLSVVQNTKLLRERMFENSI